MLRSLRVKNLALIRETEVEFGEGLNILTGETGAGKSLLIGSVNLALGGKFEKDMLRRGEESGLVELVFDCEEPRLAEKLKSMDILERQIDSTIDEKIDSLVEWRKKYPKIRVTPIATDEELREYARTDEEFSQIQEKYKKMQKYYDYVKYRKYQGKLNKEQMEKDQRQVLLV